MNLNEFATTIAQQEGLKQQVNIAQIKEITRIILKNLARQTPEQVQKTLQKYREEKP